MLSFELYISYALARKILQIKNKLKQTRRLNVPDNRVIFVTDGVDKKQESGPNKILIDDSQKNINSWKSAGGIGILHTSNEDTIKQLMKYFQ